jgi:ParB-like chromosome segregation protein Spo0J
MLSILREDPAFVPRNAPPGIGPGMVPVMWEDFATEAQFEAFAIADNRQAKNAEDDESALAVILEEMDAQGLGFDGMGFDAQEIEQALQEMPELDLDDLGEDFVLAESDGMFKFFALVANENAADAKAAISWWKQRQGLPKAHRTEIVVGELLLHWWQENKASRAPAFETAEEVEHGEA